MSEYGREHSYRPNEDEQASRPGPSAESEVSPVMAEPYLPQPSQRYPDPQRSDFQPYSGPYSQSYSQPYESRGYPAARTYPGPLPYPTQPDHPQAGTVLALGVVGIFVPVVSFVAWYLGSRTEHEIEDSGMDYANSGTLAAGKILGMVLSILQLVGLGLMMVWIVFLVLVSAG